MKYEYRSFEDSVSSLPKIRGTFPDETNLLESGEGRSEMQPGIHADRTRKAIRVESDLTCGLEFGFGEVTERPKVRHWKCRVGVKPHRGFESRPLRFFWKSKMS